MSALDWDEIEQLVDMALAEDVGRGDLTTSVAIPKATRGQFTMNARHPMVVAGMDVAAYVFETVSPDCEIDIIAADGARLAAGDAMARISGDAGGLLTAERTALNLLQLLTGIATYADRFVQEIKGTGAVMVDTRKTIPGYRTLSKYATRLGGVRNHRIRLDDGVLIKDNHISVAGGVTAAIEGAKRGTPLLTKIEVECDTLEQVAEAIDAGADMILLDNMSLDDLRSAVAMSAGRVPLEASGGVTIDTVRAIAETGVNFISSGRITQSPPAADIGMDVLLQK
ncbi:MAG: carboxylating nicotinate-nucleotide diphosphorylase [Rhodospirillaceae bacterium]|jgi:nicotinate-nucleotide pyrophosphorylase (carboxylating)|nr:carboxylating nicotinate-nucleotide diphosphorylase [Rhodospirillaceae bacterium]MBT5812501.1 carboxylating nicotinate-nucleotide diphosphorylase [Rhodospirillaceae bacterium]